MASLNRAANLRPRRGPSNEGIGGGFTGPQVPEVAPDQGRAVTAPRQPLSEPPARSKQGDRGARRATIATGPGHLRFQHDATSGGGRVDEARRDPVERDLRPAIPAGARLSGAKPRV